MSFMVAITQKPEGMRRMETTVEMSTDTLQLRLIKDIHSIVRVNDQYLTVLQKETLRKLGERWEVTDLRSDGSGHAVFVTAQREGYLRTWTVSEHGVARFADGDGFSVPVTRQDPLNSRPWGDGVLTEGV